jgi:hypothetical protein
MGRPEADISPMIWSRPHVFGQTSLKSLIEPAGRLLRGALRHERTRKTGSVRPQCRFDERQLDEVALGDAAATLMGNVAHAFRSTCPATLASPAP